jgi:hypothetical protein
MRTLIESACWQRLVLPEAPAENLWVNADQAKAENIRVLPVIAESEDEKEND